MQGPRALLNVFQNKDFVTCVAALPSDRKSYRFLESIEGFHHALEVVSSVNASSKEV